MYLHSAVFDFHDNVVTITLLLGYKSHAGGFVVSYRAALIDTACGLQCFQVGIRGVAETLVVADESRHHHPVMPEKRIACFLDDELWFEKHVAAVFLNGFRHEVALADFERD